MNAPMISAVISQAAKGTDAAATAAQDIRDANRSRDEKASFSAVLDSRQAPPGEPVRQIGNLGGKPLRQDSDTPEKPDEDAQALLAAIQGLIQQPSAPDAGTRPETPGAGTGPGARDARAGRASPMNAHSGPEPVGLAGPETSPGRKDLSPQALSQAIEEQLAAHGPAGAPLANQGGSGAEKAENSYAPRLKDQAASPRVDATLATAAAGASQAPAAKGSFTDTLSALRPGRPAHEAASQVPGAVPGIDPAAAQRLAGSSAMSPATAAATLRIDTPLQNPQWADDFGRQILTLTSSHARTQSAELHINPPDLGPLRISINISDNIAHAIFVSPHAAVRSAVENALPQLQQALAQSGISLGQTNVGEQRQFAEKFQQPGESKRRLSTSAIGDSTSTAGPEILARTGMRAPATDSLVDTFA